MSDAPPDDKLALTAKERILLHLKEYWKYRNEFETPGEVTQRGISEATGLGLSHIPRTLKSMKGDGMIVESKNYISGQKRRYKTYFLSDEGIKLAQKILGDIGSRDIETDAGPKPLSEILIENRYKSPLSVILSIIDGKALPEKTKTERFIVGEIPYPDVFVSRIEELEDLGEIVDSPEAKVIIVYGSRGYGTTALTAKFIEGAKENWSIIWLRLDSTQHVLEELAGMLSKADIGAKIREPGDLVAALTGRNVIVVFDGYFHVPDETVEFFADMVAAMKESQYLKMIVTAREDTPSYNRFYTIMDIDDSTVRELHIRGLDIGAFRELLDEKDIDEDALRRLYMFTRGKPSILKMIAGGDAAGLKNEAMFTPEEIKLMMYLKGQIKG